MPKKPSNPNALFDTIIKESGLKNDAALARSIESIPATISNMRAGRVQIGATMIIRIMENHHMPLARIKRLLDGVVDYA